jgi:NAD(P)H-dependent FMN reductase
MQILILSGSSRKNSNSLLVANYLTKLNGHSSDIHFSAIYEPKNPAIPVINILLN